ncbi:hypothetical protein O181_065651 [Austropuccinia psidii MF-1]|uniref:Uncharacterized protein n=1 Tax=Austropuccinia psidii MF-1 TaxID=1389203 RepID=A0A9Q3EW13_9BASI|nr:hypothetical protein [Austropuccinia psidii MF-1]
MLRCQIAIQEYRANMTIIYKECKIHTNADYLRKCPLDKVKIYSAYDPDIASKIPIHFIKVDRRESFRFPGWAPESGTSDSDNKEPQGRETPILGISSSEIHTEFFNVVN